MELLLIEFKDEEKINYVYSPQLDVTGYGYDEKEAMDHFISSVIYVIDHSIVNHSIEKVLKRMKVEDRSVMGVKFMLCSKHVCEIISKYSCFLSFKEISLPPDLADRLH